VKLCIDLNYDLGEGTGQDAALMPLISSANFGVSHDGRSVAIGGLGLWLHGRDRNVAVRVRAETEPNQGIIDPAWSPGDSLIAYSTVFSNVSFSEHSPLWR